MSVAEGESGVLRLPERHADRLYFVDNLRTWLITVVVLHHLAIVYGTGYIFYYVEPALGLYAMPTSLTHFTAPLS